MVIIEKVIIIEGQAIPYVVTDDGRVFSCRSGKEMKGRLLCGYIDIHFRVRKYGIDTRRLLHRLVAEAFIPNPNNLPQVNHKNGIKTDNRVENLEWVTAKENTLHAYRTGLAKIRCGEESGNSKYTNSQIIRVCELLNQNKFTNKEISIICGIPERKVSCIRSGTMWKSISSKYPNIKKKENRHVKFHQYVEYMILKGFKTFEMLRILQKEGLTINESRDLINNRRKAMKKYKSLRLPIL